MSDPASFPPSHLGHYVWRPVQRGDLPAIQAMSAAAVDIDGTEGPVTEERLAGIFSLLGDQVESNTMAALTTEGEAAALALVLVTPGEDEHVAMIDGLVHVDHRGRGLGSAILSWMEDRATQILAGLADGKPKVIRLSCADHLKDRIQLFTQHGFEAVRYAYKMQRSLGGPVPESSVPNGVQIVPWNDRYDRAAMNAFNDAFAGHWGLPQIGEELWRGIFVGVSQFREDLSHLALADDAVVGFCINWVDDAKNEAIGALEGWVEAIGVIPAYRGRGIASALLSRSLNGFIGDGMKRAALDVDAQNPTGALRLYEKHGFKATKRTIRFEKKIS